MQEDEVNSSTKAKNKYKKENYDQIAVVVPKGKKEKYKEYADYMDVSLNAFIVDSIESAIEEIEQTKEKTFAPDIAVVIQTVLDPEGFVRLYRQADDFFLMVHDTTEYVDCITQKKAYGWIKKNNEPKEAARIIAELEEEKC